MKQNFLNIHFILRVKFPVRFAHTVWSGYITYIQMDNVKTIEFYNTSSHPVQPNTLHIYQYASSPWCLPFIAAVSCFLKFTCFCYSAHRTQQTEIQMNVLHFRCLLSLIHSTAVLRTSMQTQYSYVQWLPQCSCEHFRLCLAFRFSGPVP